MQSQAAWEVLFVPKRDNANEAELLARTISPIDTPDELPIFTAMPSGSLHHRGVQQCDHHAAAGRAGAAMCSRPPVRSSYSYTHGYVTTREQSTHMRRSAIGR